MTLPNFLVIGASRSGTTSLQRHLARHPDIFVSPSKSPNYFASADPLPPWETPVLRAMARQWVSRPDAYEALFAGARGERIVAEVSPVYLQSRGAPQRIRETCGEPKLAAILRDPAERAHAHFLGRRRDGLETRDDFAAVVDAELARPLPDDVAFGSYVGASRYHHFLSAYFKHFAASRIHVTLFEDFRSDPAGALGALFDFLGVERIALPEADTRTRHNESGEIRNAAARWLWTRSVRARTALRPYLPAALRDLVFGALGGELVKPRLAPQTRARIVAALDDDIERLQALIGRDLSAWRSVERPRRCAS